MSLIDSSALWIVALRAMDVPGGIAICHCTPVAGTAGAKLAPMIHATAPSTAHLPEGDWPTALDSLCACFPRIPREQWLDRVRRGRVLDAQGAPIDEHTPHRA